MTSFSVLLSGFSIKEGISFTGRLSYHNLAFHSLRATFRGCVNVFNLSAGLLPPSSIWANRIWSTTVSRDVFVTVACLLDNHLTKISLCSVKSVDTPSYLQIVDSPISQWNPIQVLHCPAVQKVLFCLLFSWWFSFKQELHPANHHHILNGEFFYTTCPMCEVHTSPSITLFLLKIISLYFLIQYKKVKLTAAVVLLVKLLTSLDQ